MYWQADADEKKELEKYVDNITLRSGCSILRYYLREMHPEMLDEDTWCEALMDVWVFRRKESGKTIND